MTMATASRRGGFAISRTTVETEVMSASAPKTSATRPMTLPAAMAIASPRGGDAMATSTVRMPQMRL